MHSTRHHSTHHYVVADPVLRFVQGSVVEPPLVGSVDDSVPKTPSIPTIECRFMPQTGGAAHNVDATQHAPMICEFVRGKEAPLGTYMNQETGSIISCTGTRQNFMCQLRPTYELAEAAPGGFVVSLSDRGPSIQAVNITRTNISIPLFIKQ